MTRCFRASSDGERVDVLVWYSEFVVRKRVPGEQTESDCCGQPFYGNIH